MVALTTLLILSCRKNNSPEDTNTTTKKTTHQLFGKTGSGCTCNSAYSNPNCGDCIHDLMGDQNVKTYTVKWENCNPSCSPTSTTTNFTLCYAEPDPGTTDCNLYCTIDQLPSCVQCFCNSYPCCLKLKTSCTSNGTDITAILNYTDPQTGNVTQLTFTITDDPKASVCCTNSATGVQTCCSGELL